MKKARRYDSMDKTITLYGILAKFWRKIDKQKKLW